MSQFDPNQFLDMQFTEANDTVIINPDDGEYQAQIEKIDFRPWQSKSDPSKAGLALDITWELQSEAARQKTGRDKVTVRQGLMLDMLSNGGFDMGKGKNIGLGRLREAVGQNVSGRPWTPSQLIGQMAKVLVKQRVDGDSIYVDVKGVTKL